MRRAVRGHGDRSQLPHRAPALHVHQRRAQGRHQGVPRLDPERRRAVHHPREGLRPRQIGHLLVSHYEQRLANDKAAIRNRIVTLGRQCAGAVERATTATLEGDRPKAYRVVLDDLPINRESRSIDKACHAFVARHLPSAAHLRFVSSVMRMNIELERVGDYAVSIARHAVQLDEPPHGHIAEEMKALGRRAKEMLDDALSAFESGDAELARETKPVAKAMQHGFDAVFEQLTTDESISRRRGAHLFAIFNKLERVADQAKNI
ncbi:MAG TPA: hypothetical protein ENK57_25115, partial [Polyangiaceae bacterium]|nr:hypothetical protein [Polyangiaceae bacterium]